MEEMPDKENEPLAANAPATEAQATDAPATDAPAADALAIDSTPADASATEATLAEPTVPKLTKAQQQKKDRERHRAARPEVIATPVRKIVSVNRTGLLGRIRTDNSGKKGGQVEILDSNGDSKWYYAGALADVEQKEKDAFEKKEKESRGEPYFLGGDVDASESDCGDEALDEPPVAKDETVEDLGKSRIEGLLRYVKDPATREGRRRRAGVFAKLLADVSEEKADARAALIASTGAIVQKAWDKYEKHQKKYPGLYPEEEPEEAAKDYSDVPIDHVDLAPSVKDQYRKQIQECVGEGADLSSVEAMSCRDVREDHFLMALAAARGESRDQQQSDRVAGVVAPALPTISNPGESQVYRYSTDAPLIKDEMVADAKILAERGTLVPSTGLAGRARRGGFQKGVGRGNTFRIVGVQGGCAFEARLQNAILESDTMVAFEERLRIDVGCCFRKTEWKVLLPACVLAARQALELLPASSSDRDRAKAVFGAYYSEVEKHESKELVAIGADADALRERFEGRAQHLADYNYGRFEKAGLASADSGAAFDNLDEAHKALARSQLGETRRGPTGDERAINNLEPNYNGERHKAGHQEFGHLVNDFSDWLGDGGS